MIINKKIFLTILNMTNQILGMYSSDMYAGMYEENKFYDPEKKWTYTGRCSYMSDNTCRYETIPDDKIDLDVVERYMLEQKNLAKPDSKK